MGNRPLHDIEDDLRAACLCMSELATHVVDQGSNNAQILVNLERAADGFKRLVVERRAATHRQ